MVPQPPTVQPGHYSSGSAEGNYCTSKRLLPWAIGQRKKHCHVSSTKMSNQTSGLGGLPHGFCLVLAVSAWTGDAKRMPIAGQVGAWLLLTLIPARASEQGLPGVVANRRWATGTPGLLCDTWLRTRTTGKGGQTRVKRQTQTFECSAFLSTTSKRHQCSLSFCLRPEVSHSSPMSLSLSLFAPPSSVDPTMPTISFPALRPTVERAPRRQTSPSIPICKHGLESAIEFAHWGQRRHKHLDQQQRPNRTAL